MDNIYEPYWSNYFKQFDLPDDNFQFITNDTDKYCVIVEPRDHPLLIPVIQNFMYLLQKKSWGLIIFHGNKNGPMLKDKMANWKNVNYINIGVDNLTPNEYNKLMINQYFWKSLQIMGCKHALLFQTDVLLLKDNIDDFLQYDFIGAPWSKNLYDISGGYNGGFSLRNVDTLIQITSTKPHLRLENTGDVLNEDVYFAYYMVNNENNYNLPDKDVAMAFSMETIYSENPCGLHKPHMNIFPEGAYKDLLSKKH